MKENKFLKGKLIDTLKTLSAIELKQLEQYVNSPFFNTNDRVILLLKTLKRYQPHFSEIKKDKVFKAVFKTKTVFQANLLRAVVAQLAKLVEQFVIYLEYQESPQLKEEQLLNALMKRKLIKQYNQLYIKIQERWKNAPIKDSEFLRNRMTIHKIHNQFVTTNNPRQYNAVFQEFLHDLDKYYLANKLKYTTIVRMWKKVINCNFEIWMEQEILDFIGQQGFSKIPAIHVYQELIKLLDGLGDDSIYQETKVQLLGSLDNFEVIEQRQIITSLINCATWKTKDSPDIYMKEKFELYRIMIDQKLLYEDGNAPLAPHHFRNIVKTAIEVKEYEWVQTFALTYKTHLNHPQVENIVLYSLGEIYMATNQINKAAEVVSKINTEFEDLDFYYQLYYRTLVSKIAFSKGNTTWLESTLEAFRQYLRRNKAIPDDLKLAYKNFIRVVKKLKSKKVTTLEKKEFIASLEALAERNWLIGKV